ncbi:MAG: hypothetical protein NC393_06785 [Clostridium sp.]|nr:hypothetical protein [Clostridium sp.]MCM1171818.1 hypothetical protein [Clostridium sp.]MCM1207772.1 hypothetical protein [Ruminococcus sp.]
MASNPHGNNNEKEMSNYLDGKKIKELNPTMKEFVKYICFTKNILFDDTTSIKAMYETNPKLKQDIYLTINDIKIGVSLKMGSGNSCHQEKIEDFISFIRISCDASDEICDLWRFFIWADGTLDGSGSTDKDSSGRIKCRFNANEFKEKYPSKRTALQQFLNNNKAVLIERALFIGKYNSDVDFVYHGTYKQGRWISKKEVIDFLVRQSPKSNRACLTIGSLTVQAWNVSLMGNTEHKRGEIQLKYGTMKEDFDILMKNNADSIGTFLGNLEEFDLTQTMNKNKDNSMWKTLLPEASNYSDYYLVKVSSNQPSKLSGKKVKPKSDAYAIKAQLPKSFLLQKEYVLEESDLSGFDFEAVADTGISIKMKNSKNYTYQKLTRNSFCKAFSELEDVEFWLTSLLIYSADKERHKNERIITDLGNTLDSFLDKVHTNMGIAIDTTDCSSFWDTVRKTAQNKIKNYIENNNELSDNIFTGKHWFEAPYHATFLYEGGQLKKNIVTSFSITTGSGRSHGNYTIEITPAK